MNDEKRSLARAKKSGTTIAELLIKEGVSAVLPAGGVVYDAAAALVRHGVRYFSDRTASRIEEFHSALLQGGGDQEQFKQFAEKPFELDDYYAVLTSCVQDVESEKVNIYSCLMKTLIKTDMKSGIRRHFIKSCGELTYSELSLLRRIYIKSNYDLMADSGVCHSGWQSGGDLRMLAISRLQACGFVRSSDQTITELAKQFVGSIFSPNELTPESIGERQFSGVRIAILSYQLGDPEHGELAQGIQQFLLSRQIRSSISIVPERNAHLNTAAILIVGGGEFESKHVEALSNFARSVPMLRLNVSEESCINKFEGVSFCEEVNCKQASGLLLNAAVDEFVGELLKSK